MLGLTITRRAIQVPTKRFATRSISRPTVSFRPRTTSLASDSSFNHFQQSLKTPFARHFHHETGSSTTTAGTREASNERKEVDDLSRDERYMVARILVGTVMSIITRMDDPRWFEDNAEPHVFSQARYDKLVEDLKGLGREDPNAMQALERNVLWEAEEAEHSVSAETMLEVIRSLKGDTDPEAVRMVATLEAACWRIWKCASHQLENLPPEERSERFWDHVDYSDRL